MKAGEWTNWYPAPHPQVAWRMIDGEALLVLADAGEVAVLNGVGSRIWQLADGSRSIDDIITVIVAEYDTTADEAGRDVVDFIEQLVKEHILVLSERTAPQKAEKSS